MAQYNTSLVYGDTRKGGLWRDIIEIMFDKNIKDLTNLCYGCYHEEIWVIEKGLKNKLPRKTQELIENIACIKVYNIYVSSNIVSSFFYDAYIRYLSDRATTLDIYDHLARLELISGLGLMNINDFILIAGLNNIETPRNGFIGMYQGFVHNEAKGLFETPKDTLFLQHTMFIDAYFPYRRNENLIQEIVKFWKFYNYPIKQDPGKAASRRRYRKNLSTKKEKMAKNITGNRIVKCGGNKINPFNNLSGSAANAKKQTVINKKSSSENIGDDFEDLINDLKIKADALENEKEPNGQPIHGYSDNIDDVFSKLIEDLEGVTI